MAKWFGKIGFIKQVEETDNQGIFSPVVTEREYYGDIMRNSYRLQQGRNKVNDDINISNSFSILSDPYAIENISAMAYLTYANTKWKITDVEASNYPRLVLTVGGVYNE